MSEAARKALEGLLQEVGDALDNDELESALSWAQSLASTIQQAIDEKNGVPNSSDFRIY